MNLEIYQKLCSESKVLWTQHCLQRMQERDISRADVKNGIATGEIIEDQCDFYRGSFLRRYFKGVGSCRFISGFGFRASHTQRKYKKEGKKRG